MARKREESRDVGRKHKRHSQKPEKRYGHESKGVDAETLKSQLALLGLTLREVPGDGNCLFRALGDQLDGHMGNHYRLRQDTTNYMREHREDFQPFVEDDVPFEKHVSELSQLGTYAGNDAIVAFARLHQVVVVIHQPNAPVWQIKGWENTPESSSGEKKKTKHGNTNNTNSKQLHIAYHGGDHYDSVRKTGDVSHLPANIFLNIDSTSNSDACQIPRLEYYEFYESLISETEQNMEVLNVLELEAMERSGCDDLCLVRELLNNNDGNLEATIEDLIEVNLKWSCEASCSAASKPAAQQSHGGGKARGNLNKKQLEKIRKHERKRASENRKKSQAEEVPDETFITGKVQCLSI